MNSHIKHLPPIAVVFMALLCLLIVMFNGIETISDFTLFIQAFILAVIALIWSEMMSITEYLEKKEDDDETRIRERK